MLVHYHRGEERAARRGGRDRRRPDRAGRPHRRGGRRPPLRDGARDARLGRRVRGGRGRLAVARTCPVWELPLERWEETIRQNLTATFLTARGVPARGRAHGPRLARARRLDGGPLRRGRPRRLRRGEVRAPGRPAAVAEERGGAGRAARARERRRARLDRVADDARARRRRGRAAHLAHDGAAQGRRSPRTWRPRSSCSPRDVLSGHVSGQVVTVAGGMEGRVVHDDEA